MLTFQQAFAVTLLITSITISSCSRFNEDEYLNAICEVLVAETQKYEESLTLVPSGQLDAMNEYKSMVSRTLKTLYWMEYSENRQTLMISLLTLESYLSEYLLYEELQNQIYESRLQSDNTQGEIILRNQNFISPKRIEKISEQNYNIKFGSAMTRLSCNEITSTTPLLNDMKLVTPR